MCPTLFCKIRINNMSGGGDGHDDDGATCERMKITERFCHEDGKDGGMANWSKNVSTTDPKETSVSTTPPNVYSAVWSTSTSNLQHGCSSSSHDKACSVLSTGTVLLRLNFVLPDRTAH